MSGLGRASAGRNDVEAADGRRGPQGEGSIEGLHAHYMLRALHDHDFRYSRFNCTSVLDMQSYRHTRRWSELHRPSNRWPLAEERPDAI